MGAPQYTVSFGAALLRAIGAPVTAANERRLSAWAQEEGTSARFNPFATTKAGPPGTSSFNSVGVKNYPSAAAGVAATAATLLQPNMSVIVSALRNPNETDAQFAAALGSSPWSGGGASGHTAYGNAIARILNVGPSQAPLGQTIVTTADITSTSSSTSGGCVFKAPKLGPVGGFCVDKIVGGLAIAGGALLIIGGVGFVALYALRKVPAAGAIAGALPGPAGAVAKTAVSGKAPRSSSSKSKPTATPKGAEGAGGTDARAQAASKAAAERAAASLRSPRPRPGDRSTPGLGSTTAAAARRRNADRPGPGTRRAPMTRSTYAKATGEPAPF